MGWRSHSGSAKFGLARVLVELDSARAVMMKMAEGSNSLFQRRRTDGLMGTEILSTHDNSLPFFRCDIMHMRITTTRERKSGATDVSLGHGDFSICLSKLLLRSQIRL